MRIYKSDVYTTIALILLVVCFTFPAIAFYKVPQKIAAGQIDSIPSYVYPLWNLYQKGRYVSPYTPKGAEGDLKKMIEKKGEVGMMSFPVWYVALEAPNYPKAAFPEGIPVWFHVLLCCNQQSCLQHLLYHMCLFRQHMEEQLHLLK